jgi:hypothetical protein
VPVRRKDITSQRPPTPSAQASTGEKSEDTHYDKTSIEGKGQVTLGSKASARKEASGYSGKTSANEPNDGKASANEPTSDKTSAGE